MLPLFLPTQGSRGGQLAAEHWPRVSWLQVAKLHPSRWAVWEVGVCPDFRTKALRIRKLQLEARRRKPRVRPTLTGDVGRSYHSSVAALWNDLE